METIDTLMPARRARLNVVRAGTRRGRGVDWLISVELECVQHETWNFLTILTYSYISPRQPK